MASVTKSVEFSHIVLTSNKRKYILCLYKMLKDEKFTLAATDGDSLYKTTIKYEELKKIWNNFALASVEVKEDKFLAKLPDNVECVLTAVRGEKKAEEMFSLIVTSAESNQIKRIDREKDQQSTVSSLPNVLPDGKSQLNRVKKLKGSSIVMPSKKKRKAASGVIYEG